jgi:hypothetical protein
VPPKPWKALALAAVLLILFLGKAMTIDDPLFIWTARQIQKSPLDPYGFEFNWFGQPLSMSYNVQNPPVTSYWLALVGMGGWNEYWLHFTMLPWAILLLWGVVRLARSLGSDPFWAAILTLGTSAYLVSATNVMCDVMMLAFMVWSVAFWVEGLENGRYSTLVLAALLGGLAALTKYFALSIIPLLAAYTMIRAFRREKVAHALITLSPLLVTAALVAVWHFWSRRLYGVSHISGAATYAESASALEINFDQLYSGVIFLGGCVFWPLIVGISRAKLTGRVALAIAAAAGPIGLRLALQHAERPEVLALNPFLYVIAAVFFAAGVAAVCLTGQYLWERAREPAAWLLSLWVFGTIVFMVAFNWTVAARNVLPLVPPLALLVSIPVKQGGTGADRRFGREGERKCRRIPLVVAGAIGLLVAVLAAHADFAWANSVKGEAIRLAARYTQNGRTVFFQGHWGFQYYMMEHGGTPMDSRQTSFPQSCVLIAPLNNTNLELAGFSAWRLLEDKSEAPAWKVRLADPRSGAGFYSRVFGPLPLSVTALSDNRYIVLAPPN